MLVHRNDDGHQLSRGKDRVVYVDDADNYTRAAPHSLCHDLPDLDKEDLVIKHEIRISKAKKEGADFDNLLRLIALIGVLTHASGQC